MSILQSFAWWSFHRPHTDPAALLRAAADTGYAGVDLIDEALWPLAQSFGLQIAAVNGHASITHGLNDPTQHRRIERELLANLRLAEQYAIPNLIVFSGNRHSPNRSGTDESSGHDAAVEALQTLAPHAENAGVTLVLELLNSRVDHPGYQADRTDWGVGVVEAVASPRVKLLYDVYHMQIMEGDLIRTIGRQQDHIAHYHTAGNPGRGDLDDQQEIQYAPVLRAIRDTGFGGFVAHEFIPGGDPATALRQTFELCQAHLG
ncbi:hydroxypyruvate isomerase family protein [Deinococcus alpinitundrae]|uniref:hydroxypyruvate isomerase family protein n=1 Tax=Deinococcus alpinitundrae TaxID=468913 RepID=UPI00192A4155|nr:TIM barrel protein [Deinococcus alpinitundrae]